MREMPSAMRRQHDRAMRDRLVAGHVAASPSSGAPGAAIQSLGGAVIVSDRVQCGEQAPVLVARRRR